VVDFGRPCINGFSIATVLQRNHSTVRRCPSGTFRADVCTSVPFCSIFARIGESAQPHKVLEIFDNFGRSAGI
jgi:hypothetical protein